MFDICLFAGTSEGRQMAEVLMNTPLKVLVCVATEYGETLVTQSDHMVVHTGRLDEEAMVTLFRKEGFSLIIDATHPFAVRVTENIAAAAMKTGSEYVRLSRETEKAVDNAVYVNSITEAAEYLKDKEGNILVTTGSKELKPYTVIKNYQERMYVRVLPMQASLCACEEMGIKLSHIIAMQGPFSKEVNRALLSMTKAKYLVTKDSGSNGGFSEKIQAALEETVIPVVIGRPTEKNNKSFREVLSLLSLRYQIQAASKIHVVGIGMGNEALLTFEAKEALNRADCIIGAKRAVEAVNRKSDSFCSMDYAKILEFIKAHPEYREIAIVMTGDTGFYSGTKKLLPLLKEYDTKVYPGISSLQYLCAKSGISWDDAYILSLHGREGSAVPAVIENEKVFVLLGGAGGVKRVLDELCAHGLGEIEVYVGERLSYPEERIVKGTAGELCMERFDPLSVLLILNRRAKPSKYSASLPDEAFVRSKGDAVNVPMTKAEVRAVSVAKLMLQPDSVVYDIGAGTGSVSIEMAAICKKGHVYAVECKKEAAELANKNKNHFGAWNLTVIEGMAPEICRELPIPTHAFIGGTSGNMYEIIEMLLQKNPQIRIVINLIALESIAEIMRCLEAFHFEETEIVQISVAKARKLGRYHLMNGQNPIMIITCQKHEEQTEDRLCMKRERTI